MEEYNTESHNNISDYTNPIDSLGREELKRRIRDFKGRFKLDFTEDYLNKISVGRLRHILLAALINARPKSNKLEDKTK